MILVRKPLVAALKRAQVFTEEGEKRYARNFLYAQVHGADAPIPQAEGGFKRGAGALVMGLNNTCMYVEMVEATPQTLEAAATGGPLVAMLTKEAASALADGTEATASLPLTGWHTGEAVSVTAFRHLTRPYDWTVEIERDALCATLRGIRPETAMRGSGQPRKKDLYKTPIVGLYLRAGRQQLKLANDEASETLDAQVWARAVTMSEADVEADAAPLHVVTLLDKTWLARLAREVGAGAQKVRLGGWYTDWEDIGSEYAPVQYRTALTKRGWERVVMGMSPLVVEAVQPKRAAYGVQSMMLRGNVWNTRDVYLYDIIAHRLI